MIFFWKVRETGIKKNKDVLLLAITNAKLLVHLGNPFS